MRKLSQREEMVKLLAGRARRHTLTPEQISRAMDEQEYDVSGLDALYAALEARGIRCASGGGTDLLQTEEIGTLRSFLQIIWNPRQDIPLVSTLASPIFGFTADELAEIRSARVIRQVVAA